MSSCVSVSVRVHLQTPVNNLTCFIVIVVHVKHFSDVLSSVSVLISGAVLCATVTVVCNSLSYEASTHCGVCGKKAA